MATRKNHARELRTIGQELMRRGIDLFELRCLRTEYYLQCGDPQPPHTSLLRLSFAPEEVINMDLAAAAGRGKRFKRVDFESLPEILRALGGYVESKGGNLLRISHADAVEPSDNFVVEYEGRDGRICREELLISTLADEALRMYKTRLRNRADTLWRH